MAGTESIAGKAARFVVRDVLLDAVRFPVWWYTTGTRNAWRFFVHELLSALDRLSIRILLRNFFKPMYGDYSRSGRVISLFMRLLMFAFQAARMVIWTAVMLAMLIAWLLILPVTLYQLVLQLTQ